jgi:AraC-like DNA-binding protein
VRRELHNLEFLLRARTLIELEFASDLNLQRLAAESGFSRHHFTREFRRAFRYTPHQYLTRRRMERAKELLRNQELSVSQVCLAVGYRSMGSFSTAFTRATGASPIIYRFRLAQQIDQRKWVPACYLAMFGPDRRSA